MVLVRSLPAVHPMQMENNIMVIQLLDLLTCEVLSGGSGQDVTNTMNPNRVADPLFGLNYGQFLKASGLNASESNAAGNLNPSNVGGVGLGKLISDIATS
ncbi:MAG: hypothetical protein FJ051_08015 [Cyanobacteria bacterium M_surface_9_m1_291]|nr:hypothetical protein [Cyanobacteria bacterium M_surface_9_m1_291]